MACILATVPDSVDDFPAFYSAAHHTSAVYSITRSETHRYFLPYLRIPTYAWMLQPVAAFSYKISREIWLGLLVAAMGFFVALWPADRKRILAALSCSVPVTLGLALGQDTIFVLLVAAVATFLWTRDRPLSAGLVIALLACKITFLPALAIPFIRSRRAAVGLALGLTVVFGVSFAIEPAWVSHYIALLRSPALDPETSKMMSLRSITSVLPFGNFVYPGGFVLLMIWMWRIAGRLAIVESVGCALAIGLIASPHCYVYDAVVLIPLFARFASFDNAPGRAAYFGLSLFPFVAVLNDWSRPMALTGSALVVVATCMVVNYCQANARQSEPFWPGFSAPAAV
jgi:Glycosyltransferase family 87